MSGAGAAGYGDPAGCCSRPAPSDVVVADVDGVVHRGRAGLDDVAARGSPTTPTPTASTGTLKEARASGADVFIGVSAPDVLDGDDVAAMARRRHRLRAGQPRPRGRPGDGPRGTPPSSPPAGRTTPTRSTTCWPSPASSGACSTRPRRPIDDSLLVAAAEGASPDVVTDDELNANYIIPSVFHADVHKAVAAAVRDAAQAAGS